MAKIPLTGREIAIVRALVAAGGTQSDWENRFEMGPIRQPWHEEAVNNMAALGMVTRAAIKDSKQSGEKARTMSLTALGFHCLNVGFYDDDWKKKRPSHEDVHDMILTWLNSAAKLARDLFPVSDDFARIERATMKGIGLLKLKQLAIKA